MTDINERNLFQRAYTGAAIGAALGAGFGIFTAAKTPLPDSPEGQFEWVVVACFATAVLACSGACVGGITFGAAANVLQQATDRLAYQSHRRHEPEDNHNSTHTHTQKLLTANPQYPTRKDTADSDELEADIENSLTANAETTGFTSIMPTLTSI